MNRVLCISLLGEPDRASRELFATIPDGATDWQWIRSRLRERGLDDRVELVGVDVSIGETLPSPEDFDGVMVGGSVHNVNEGRDWQRRTIDWLGDWRQSGRPMFGICGGHQMAAVALGGAVDRMNGKPNSETGPVELTDEGRAHFLFRDLHNAPQFHFGHFDHVTRAPDGSRLLATYRDVMAALDFGGDWYSVQFHPEATADGMTISWDDELPEEAICYRDTPDGARIIENFLRGTGLI